MNGVSKLTVTEDVSVITFNQLPNGTMGVSKILRAFSEAGINIDMISQTAPQGGDVSLSLTVSAEDLVKALTLCKRCQEAKPALLPLVSNGNCKIQLYGDEMRSMYGVAAKAIEAIEATGGQIFLITTSEVDISVLLASDKAEEAINALEAAFALTCSR